MLALHTAIGGIDKTPPPKAPRRQGDFVASATLGLGAPGAPGRRLLLTVWWLPHIVAGTESHAILRAVIEFDTLRVDANVTDHPKCSERGKTGAVCGARE